MDLYEKNWNCPVCNNNFKAPAVKSSAIKLDKKDTDFCLYYKGINPLFYDVIVCPNCGYSALSKNFNKITNKDIESIKEKVCSKWLKRNIPFERTELDAISLYKLALISAISKFKINKFEVAGILLRIAWLYRYLNDTKNELEYLSLALNNYLEVYEDNSTVSDELDSATIMYLIAELYRRIGNFEQSKRWFSMLISSKEARQNPNILDLAREQIQVIKDIQV
ncbi:DUF2225 domain-containing protein [Caldicellulosiruptoraceae bacterium PP1]